MPEHTKHSSGGPQVAGQSTAQEAKQEAASAARSLAEDAKSAARDAAESAKAEAVSRADAAKQGVAGEVRNISSALRQAAEAARDGSPQERTFGQIAEGLADVSETIAQKDLGEVAGDLSEFARRNPLAFLGGAALIGFAATRFAKAGRRSEPSAVQSTHSVQPRPGTAHTTTPTGSYPPVTPGGAS